METAKYQDSSVKLVGNYHIFIYLYHGYIIIYTYRPLSCGLSTFNTLNSKVEVFLVVLFNVAI